MIFFVLYKNHFFCNSEIVSRVAHRFINIYIFCEVLYSTSRPSGNHVDGLPLVLHNTRALVSGVLLPPALFCDNWQKLYCSSINYHCSELNESEQIKESIEIIRFYGVWALDRSKTTVSMTHQLDLFFFVFWWNFRLLFS